MRRKDREVLDPEKIDGIIRDCNCCRLGLCDRGRAYIVPLSFGFAREGGRRVFYFHSAKEGRKIDLIRQTGWAGFEMDTHYKLNESGQACGYSARFQSVIGGGSVSFAEGPEEKRAGLRAIMLQNTGKAQWEFSDEMLETVAVLKLEVEELSCKEHH